MKKVIIPQIPSGKGNIYQTASQHYDIDLNFRKNVKYAVLLPSYFEKTERYFKTAKNTLKYVNQMKNEGYPHSTIIDDDGNYIDYDELDSLVEKEAKEEFAKALENQNNG